MAVTFAQMPLRKRDIVNVDGRGRRRRRPWAAGCCSASSRTTASPPHASPAAEPSSGADRLAGYNARGVPDPSVRFGHEMNGSWYPWGQQTRSIRQRLPRSRAPAQGAPRARHPRAPNSGAGYPFAGGSTRPRREARLRRRSTPTATAAWRAETRMSLTTPGDAAVDWVGLSLYHWGSAHPWGENELPRPEHTPHPTPPAGMPASGQASGLPDFYPRYAQGRRKPLAIPETAALFGPGGGGAEEPGDQRRGCGRCLTQTSPGTVSSTQDDQLVRLGQIRAGGGRRRVDWAVTRETRCCAALSPPTCRPGWSPVRSLPPARRRLRTDLTHTLSASSTDAALTQCG